MKILHLVHSYYPALGGSQLLFQRFSEELVAAFGDEVTVFTTDAIGELTAETAERIACLEETLNGVRVRRFPYWRRGLWLLNTAARAARKLRLPFAELLTLLQRGPISFRMLGAALRSDADVVAATAFGYAHMLYPWFTRRHAKRKPFVCYGALHVVNDRVDDLTVRISNSSDAYVANTRFERDILVKHGVPAAKIHVVGPGVHFEQYTNVDHEAARRRYGIDDEPTVAYIGRQDPGKGVDTLIHAMGVVWQRIPTANLLLAGARGLLSARLRGLVAALPASQRARVRVIEDFREDEKPGLFAACDVFSMVSKFESFGITYLEAWASGKPVIGADVGAVRSVIDHETDGLLVPYGDVAELARAALRLLTDEELRATLGENGRRKVQREHTWPIVTKKLRAVYELVQS